MTAASYGGDEIALSKFRSRNIPTLNLSSHRRAQDRRADTT
jgi:hypothetical protein